jgi:hypothetical protein
MERGVSIGLKKRRNRCMELELFFLDSIAAVPVALNWPEVIEGSIVLSSEITSLPEYSSIS